MKLGHEKVAMGRLEEELVICFPGRGDGTHLPTCLFLDNFLM